MCAVIIAPYIRHGCAITAGDKPWQYYMSIAVIQGASCATRFPVDSTDNSRRSSTIHGSAPPFEGRVPYVSADVPPPACGKDRRRSRAVGDSAVSPPPSPGAALGSCSDPASRIAFRNACERVICRPHAHSRAPARAGPAPSRDRPVPAHPERQPGAHTRARAWCRCRWPLWRVPAET